MVAAMRYNQRETDKRRSERDPSYREKMRAIPESAGEPRKAVGDGAALVVLPNRKTLDVSDGNAVATPLTRDCPGADCPDDRVATTKADRRERPERRWVMVTEHNGPQLVLICHGCKWKCENECWHPTQNHRSFPLNRIETPTWCPIKHETGEGNK
jgi:hypothetical protein